MNQTSSAISIVPVLDEFERMGWPKSIRFTDPTRLITYVVRSLNDKQKKIKFRASDGNITWEPIPTP